ncbi:MAG TPA: protoporphyrinogen oxidase, partial [Chromatiaceae bacterium]|nr:protoporphyrinogen oxidase [Chromatiaceae bacterium]
AEPFIPRGAHTGETVSQFIRRRLGQEVLDTAMDAFVSGTLASDPDLAEAQSVLPRLTALEQRYGSLTLGMFINKVVKRRHANTADTFSFSGGMEQLALALADTPGITLRTGVQANRILQQHGGWSVRGSIGGQPTQTWTEHLVLGTPADTSSQLLEDTDSTLSRLLAGIEYAPVGVLHLGMKSSNIRQQLDGTGFLVAKHNQLTFNGNLWMSTMFPHRAPPGKALLSSYVGGVRHPDQLQQTDEELTDNILRSLRPLMKITGEPDFVRIRRHAKGLPLYHGQYRARLAQIASHTNALPGLQLCANYIGGVSIRERIFQGRMTAHAIAVQLQRELAARGRQRLLTTSH